jgi:hypothetical protein
MSEQLEELTQAYDAAVRAGDQSAIDDLAIQIDQCRGENGMNEYDQEVERLEHARVEA